MAFRQVESENERRTTIAMRYARKYPKLLYNHDELTWRLGQFMTEVRLDQAEALRLLAEADSLIRVEIPDQVTARYMSLDWSVLPRRTALVLMALLEMQRTDGLRMIVDTRKVIRRAELLENDLVGWKPARGAWSPKVVMDAYAHLQRMGLLDELTPGNPQTNEWSRFYPESNRATVVELVRDPQQPTLHVRGHARPSVWSVEVGSYLTSNLDITPVTTRTSKAVGVGYRGRAVSNFETDADPMMTLEDLRRWGSYASTMERATVWFRTHGNLTEFTG